MMVSESSGSGISYWGRGDVFAQGSGAAPWGAGPEGRGHDGFGVQRLGYLVLGEGVRLGQGLRDDAVGRGHEAQVGASGLVSQAPLQLGEPRVGVEWLASGGR